LVLRYLGEERSLASGAALLRLLALGPGETNPKMKKLVTTIVGAVCLLAATATIAAATTTTTTDVQALPRAESHLVTVLHGYKDTAAWKAQLKAALATQNAVVAKVNADLRAASSKSTTPTTQAKEPSAPATSFGDGTYLPGTTSGDLALVPTARRDRAAAIGRV
jgi:hypothetical protein